MKNRMMYFPLFCLLAASFLFSTPAPAQSGGGWQVQKADWGAGNRWMDVTNQVRRLLNGNGRVLVNNDTMGGDPAYGQYKILRIQATEFSRPVTAIHLQGEFVRLMRASSTTMGGQAVLDTQGLPVSTTTGCRCIPVMAVTAPCKSRARTMA